MKKVLKTILMGAVAFSLAMGVGCGTGENSSLEKESSKAEDSSSQNKRRQLRDKSDYGKVIALTFDDGPNTDTTPLVLDKLEEHGIVASFFVIGNNITDESAEVMKRAYNMGCDIENHSQSHPDMTKMTAEEIKAEIDFTSDKVEEAVVVVAAFELLSVCELSGISPHEQRSAAHIAATVKRLNVLCIFFMVLSPVFIVVCFSISHIKEIFKYGYNFVIVRLYSLLYAFLSFPYLCRIV